MNFRVWILVELLFCFGEGMELNLLLLNLKATLKGFVIEVLSGVIVKEFIVIVVFKLVSHLEVICN